MRAQPGQSLEDNVNEYRRNFLQRVQENGLELQSAPEVFKSDREIVSAAVTQNPLALKYAAENLKQDCDVVLLAMRKTPLAFDLCDFFHDPIRDNSEIMLLAGPRKLEYASDRLKAHPNFMLSMCKEELRIYKCASSVLKHAVGDAQVAINAYLASKQQSAVASQGIFSESAAASPAPDRRDSSPWDSFGM